MGRQERSVAKGIDELVKAQLLIDSEANPGLNWTEIQALRREYQGEVSSACRNRFQYLRNLKVKKKSTYWKVYTEALERVRQSKLAPRFRDNKQETEDEDEEEDEEDEDQYDDDIKKPSALLSTAALPSSTIASRPNKQHCPITTKTAPMAPRVPAVVGGFSSPSNFSVASGNSNARSKGTPRIKAQKYETLQDAIDDSHAHWVLNFEYPERNGAPYFFVQRTDDVPIRTSAGGREMVDQVRIYINQMSDLRDWELMSAMTVCEGQAFLISLPVMPKFRYNPKDVKALYANTEDDARCFQTELGYISSVKAIAKDENRLLMKCLFICPEGMLWTANMQNDQRPTTDEKARITLGEVEVEYEAGKNKSKFSVIGRPGSFVLRVFKEEKKELESDNESDESEDLDGLFQGMKIRAGDLSLNLSPTRKKKKHRSMRLSRKKKQGMTGGGKPLFAEDATKTHSPSPASKEAPFSSQASPPNQRSPATNPHSPSPALKKAAVRQQLPTQNKDVLSTPAAMSSLVQQENFVFDLSSPPQPVLAKVAYADVPSIRRTSPSKQRTTTKQLATHPVLLRNERRKNIHVHQQKKKDEVIWKKRTETLPGPAEIRSNGDSPESAKVFESLDEMMRSAKSDISYNLSNL